MSKKSNVPQRPPKQTQVQSQQQQQHLPGGNNDASAEHQAPNSVGGGGCGVLHCNVQQVRHRNSNETISNSNKQHSPELKRRPSPTTKSNSETTLLKRSRLAQSTREVSPLESTKHPLQHLTTITLPESYKANEDRSTMQLTTTSQSNDASSDQRHCNANESNVSCETETRTKETSPGPVAAKNMCAACSKPIRERYLLMALDKKWHEDCLKCACCDCRLGEVGSSLYTHSDKILCRRDFLRIFGQTGSCGACERTIAPYEMVMRANEMAFHLDCFACQQCQYRFCVGDRFHLTPETHRVICVLCHSEQQQQTTTTTNASATSSPVQVKQSQEQTRTNDPIDSPATTTTTNQTTQSPIQTTSSTTTTQTATPTTSVQKQQQQEQACAM